MSTHNRAEIIEKNFFHRVLNQDLQLPQGPVNIDEVELSKHQLVDLFESQLMSRILDLESRMLRGRNESFYTIGSSGHEGNAVFGKVFRYTDPAFLHYRSGAFFVQRAKQLPQSTPLYDMLLSFAASKEDPIAAGRHKVLGSVELNIPPQTSTIASHIPKATGTALSITRARDLKLSAKFPYDSIVICSFGDASCNHATALSGINAASISAYQNIPTPIIFICEDNNIGISVKTPDGWVAELGRSKPAVHYIYANGLNLLDIYRAAKEAEYHARQLKRPVFLHMSTVRLLGHAGSDVEILYRNLKQIEETETHDPLLYSAALILHNQILSAPEISKMYQQLKNRITRVAEICIRRPKLTTAQEVMSSIVPHAIRKARPPLPDEDTRKKYFDQEYKFLDKKQHMAKLINWSLVDLLLQYQNTVVFGEDIAQKGGVYHVTTGLYKKFGAKRVFNSVLDETSILGMAIGLAHNGFIPLPEIQFLAYVHNAEDQLRGEASTLSFFSNGQYSNPMVIRIAGLAYQKGFGGHFHNDNSLAVLRDIPGLIIACPATGDDAVKMLRTAVAEAYLNGRIVVFIEPIALYMTKDLVNNGDNGWSFLYPAPGEQIAIGEIGVFGKSDLITILTYGNGYFLSRQAYHELKEKHGIEVKIIDLRWLAPLNITAIVKECVCCPNLIIVEECRQTGSLSEQLVAQLYESLPTTPFIKRICAEDCFIPLGNAATTVLPSKDDIIAAVIKIAAQQHHKNVKPIAMAQGKFS